MPRAVSRPRVTNVQRWTKPQRLAVLLLLVAAVIILAAAGWEWLEGWAGTTVLYGIFALISLLCALGIATPWWSLQLLSAGVVIVLGDLLLGYLTAWKLLLVLRGESVIQLSTQEDRLFVAGIPVVSISLAVPVLVVYHWIVSARPPRRR